jgi:hypothetical protein
VPKGSRLARLNEIPTNPRIEMYCAPCDRAVLVDAKALGRRYGWRLTLPDLESRLRCTACGGSGRFRVEGAAVWPDEVELVVKADGPGRDQDG